ncbi:putative lipoprotein [Leptospira sp. 'Mane']|uniref:putative lipoprotein n=1 Tax=Leptospira sp. 'Mane' TaxID=3387407 RepID=UPI00398AFC0D
MIRNKVVLIVSMLAALALTSQCAILDSASGLSGRIGFSISDSTSTLFNSLSKSVTSLSGSSSGGKEEALREYREDVKSALVLFCNHPDSRKDLETDLNSIAKEHGLVSWKNHPATYIAMGQGLYAAGAGLSELEEITSHISVNHKQMAALVKEGYQSVH